MDIGLEKLYSGDFNNMDQQWLPDGSVIITLGKTGEDVNYRFKVKDLYREHEQVLSHEVVPIKRPKWLNDRIKGVKDRAGEDKG